MHKDDAGVFISGSRASRDVRKNSKDGKPAHARGGADQDLTSAFVESIAGHRHWERELMAKEVPY